MAMEVPLLTANEECTTKRWWKLAGNLNRVNVIALPMIVVTLSQYLQRTSPIFMLGHLGELTLSGACIATTFSNVTGFSLLYGMSSALETLCGQAYGAKQLDRVGIFAYGSIPCLFIVCLPVCVLWIYTEELLIFAGQDPLISAEAAKYTMHLIPTLFPYAILQALVRYLQAQSLISPMLWTSLLSLCCQLLLCWAFVFKFDLGNPGAAMSIGISYWFNVVLLVIFVKYSPACEKTRASFTKDVFLTMRVFFRFAIPSAIMVCLEWWCFELVILLSGLLPNPQLATSTLSICVTITSLHYHIPYSFGAAASTLVSNELGAGKPDGARVAVYAVVVLAVAEFLIASMTIYLCGGILGYAFSGEKEVVDGVKAMVPLLCMSIIMDSSQAVLSGVARGSGWQHIGAYVNLGSYYIVALPLALVLGFVLDLKGTGLWSGLVVGATVQSISLSLVTSLTNWDKKAKEARERVFTHKIPVDH